MKNIEIYEPAMCCSTGLCGVSVDPELLRISTVLNTLQQRGITVKRFNLSNAPMAFVNNKAVNEFVKLYGADKLPVTVVDGRLLFPAAIPQIRNLPSGLICRKEPWANRNPVDAAVKEDAADAKI